MAPETKLAKKDVTVVSEEGDKATVKFCCAEGKEEELYGRLQQRLGKTKEEVRDEIEKL